MASLVLSVSAGAGQVIVTVRGATRSELLRVDGEHVAAIVAPAIAAEIPRGRYIAIGYDSQGDAVSVSPPFNAMPGTAVEIALVPPATGSDVIAILSNATDAVPFLQRRSADVVTRVKNDILAIWYGVEDRLAAIAITSEKSFLDPLDIRPRPRAVTMVRVALRDLPTLNVHIDATGELGKTRIRLKPLDGTAVLAERELANEKSVPFTSLKPAIYSVELVLPEWTATTRADLTGGEDFDVTIKVEPIAITGRITRDGKPVHAQVALRYGRNMPKTETDEEGSYALRVWTPGRYQLEVTPTEPIATEPHLDMLLIRDDQTVDVDLPADRFAVQVVDATTKKPIGGARLSVTSARKNGRTMRSVTTSADGVALLPPLYPGELVLQASADGFLQGQPMTLQVPGAPAEIQIALRREGETTALSVVLPNGAPAASAEVIAVRDLRASYAVLWQGRTDATGTIHVPTSMNGVYLAVRHTSAAGTIRPWQSQSGAPWKLQPAAESFVLRSRPATSVTGWIDGIRVSGALLQFLAWSNDTTDGNGVWIGHRLPAFPLRVLVGNTTGTHDALATQVAHPWNGPQMVTAID